MLICPNCHAEYRDGFHTCSDCDVPLQPAAAQPLARREPIPEPGDPSGDPFCSFWTGSDARVHAELGYVLDEAGIPHRTIRRHEHLFNLSNYPAFQIGVPFSLYENAENAVRYAFELDPDDPDAITALDSPALTVGGNSSRIKRLPSSLSPPSDLDIPGPPPSPAELVLGDEDGVEIWSGADAHHKEMFLASLNENGIASRWSERDGAYALLVLRECAGRAREIIREIVNTSPPE